MGAKMGIGSTRYRFKKEPPTPLDVCYFSAATHINHMTETCTLLCCIGVVAQSENLNINPLWFGLSATMAASYAFMLPIATPVNALVFSSGHVTVPDMASIAF